MGVRVVAGAREPARLVRARDGARGDHRRAAAARSWTTSRACTARWPFFASVLDNAELSLAKADLGTFRRYADLAEGDEATAIRGMIEAEYARSVAAARSS